MKAWCRSPCPAPGPIPGHGVQSGKTEAVPSSFIRGNCCLSGTAGNSLRLLSQQAQRTDRCGAGKLPSLPDGWFQGTPARRRSISCPPQGTRCLGRSKRSRGAGLLPVTEANARGISGRASRQPQPSPIEAVEGFVLPALQNRNRSVQGESQPASRSEIGALVGRIAIAQSPQVVAVLRRCLRLCLRRWIASGMDLQPSRRLSSQEPGTRPAGALGHQGAALH